MVVPENTKPKDTSNKIPDSNSNTSNASIPTTTQHTLTPIVTKEPEKVKDKTILDDATYKPNNIIFLVDVSSSMSDTLKLKVMQSALHY